MGESWANRKVFSKGGPGRGPPFSSGRTTALFAIIVQANRLVATQARNQFPIIERVALNRPGGGSELGKEITCSFYLNIATIDGLKERIDETTRQRVGQT